MLNGQTQAQSSEICLVLCMPGSSANCCFHFSPALYHGKKTRDQYQKWTGLRAGKDQRMATPRPFTSRRLAVSLLLAPCPYIRMTRHAAQLRLTCNSSIHICPICQPHTRCLLWKMALAQSARVPSLLYHSQLFPASKPSHVLLSSKRPSQAPK